MRKAIAIPKSGRVAAQTKVRPFRHTFEVPSTAVVKSFKPVLGKKGSAQTIPTSPEPSFNPTPWPGVKSSDPIQKRARRLRNRAAGGK